MFVIQLFCLLYLLKGTKIMSLTSQIYNFANAKAVPQKEFARSAYSFTRTVVAIYYIVAVYNNVWSVECIKHTNLQQTKQKKRC